MLGGDFTRFAAGFAARYPWLPAPLARHYARLYGTRAEALLDGATSLDGLGRHFGGLLYAREAEFLRATEWARRAEDVLDRRTKHGIRLTGLERQNFMAWWAASTDAAAVYSNYSWPF